MFEDEIQKAGLSSKINACGGIRTVERLKERTKSEMVQDIQIFTPLIMEGPAILREFRRYMARSYSG